MDPFLASMPTERDRDLMLCRQFGAAYQIDMASSRVRYGARYWEKVSAYEGNAIATKVIRGRVDMLARHAQSGASTLDYGCGTGAFVRAAAERGYGARGFEVMPEAVVRLKRDALYADNVSTFDVVTLWDVIEHLENPQELLNQVKPGAILLASVPVFESLDVIRESKHYRPGEHLMYFTVQGFVHWLGLHGFQFLEFSYHEIDAGRDSIGAFAFIRAR